MANSTRFITGIRWYKGLLEALNNMTFIYDVNWNPNNSPKATFPVCFFHVKSCHEVMNTEVSQKQMLFYNSMGDKSQSDPLVASEVAGDSGLLNVVADNIVIKPKVYKLDVIIPYRQLTLTEQSFVYNSHTAQAIQSVLISKGSEESKAFNAKLSSYATLSQPYAKLIKTLLSYLVSYAITGDYSWKHDDNFNLKTSVKDWIENTEIQPDYNKESLETMWRLRHIVKMKMWNSWKYKYVAIMDMDITKEGTEDGVYEATLTLQEMPIISMYPQGFNLRKTYEQKNPLVSVKGKAVINALNVAGGDFSKGE